MWNAIKEMLSSKKFIASAVGVIVWLLSKAGLDLDAGEATAAISPLLTYILGQGIADHGKSKALTEAAGK